jgi:general stress protein 26
MQTTDFSTIEPEFHKRIARIVWCTVTTIDRAGRPRSRILHPIWEGTTGWIATGRHTLKTKHLASNNAVSLSYWDQEHQQVYVDADAQWVDDESEKVRIWELFKSTPPPLGYDLGMIWQGGVEDPAYGLLQLTPRRIELYSLGDLFQGREPDVWRPG